VEVLSLKNKGLSRSEIIAQTGFRTGGGLSLALKELMECGFVKKLHPFRTSKEGSLYRLIDEYTHFYFKFLASQKTSSSWLQLSEKPAYKTWSGFAFENLCLKHSQQIKQALGIHGIITNEFCWTQVGSDTTPGTQIDLVMDRSDNCINLFEMKFHNGSFTITKPYSERLQTKVQVFKEQTGTQKNVFLTFLTVYGVAKNKYYLSLGVNQVLVEDLFRKTEVIF
jgi:hypothetical protein